MSHGVISVHATLYTTAANMSIEEGKATDNHLNPGLRQYQIPHFLLYCENAKSRRESLRPA